MILRVKFSENNRFLAVKFQDLSRNFAVQFKELSKTIAVNFGEVQPITEYIGGEKYEGEYIVTPKVESQAIPTKSKVMLEDVTIKSIPFFNVGNTSGGSTVYIGNEV